MDPSPRLTDIGLIRVRALTEGEPGEILEHTANKALCATYHTNTDTLREHAEPPLHTVHIAGDPNHDNAPSNVQYLHLRDLWTS
jgi:hypothetical protein